MSPSPRSIFAVVRLGLIPLMLAGCYATTGWQGRFPTPPSGEPVTDSATEHLRQAVVARIPVCVAELEGQFGRRWKADPQSGTGLVGLHLDIWRGESSECEFHACTSGNGNDVRIGFRAEPFLSGYRDLDKTVCHEMVHAYFRRFLSTWKYSHLPRWAREGSAVYLAGQLSERLHTNEFRNFEHPGKVINGLEGPHSEEDYLEDALAFEFLDSRENGHAVRALNAVLAGQDIFDGIQSVSGLDRKEFIHGAKAFAGRRVNENHEGLPASLHAAQAARHARGSGSARNARDLYEKVLADEGVTLGNDGIAVGTITPAAGKALSEIFEIDRAMPRHYRRSHGLARFLLSSVPPEYYGMWVANVRYGLASVASDLGYYEEALAEYSKVFSLHIESPNLQDGSTMGIARTYYDARDYTHALKWLERQRDDGTYVFQEVRYKRGMSLFHLCRGEEGIATLEDVASGPERHVWPGKARESLEGIRAGELVAASCPQ